MKRTGYLYDRLCERTTLEKAFAEASRGKKNKRYVKPYIERQDYYIDKLQRWLKDGTLKLTENKHKTIYERSAKKITRYSRAEILSRSSRTLGVLHRYETRVYARNVRVELWLNQGARRALRHQTRAEDTAQPKSAIHAQNGF